jgi:hypothetical protein
MADCGSIIADNALEARFCIKGELLVSSYALELEQYGHGGLDPE